MFFKLRFLSGISVAKGLFFISGTSKPQMTFVELFSPLFLLL